MSKYTDRQQAEQAILIYIMVLFVVVLVVVGLRGCIPEPPPPVTDTPVVTVPVTVPVTEVVTETVAPTVVPTVVPTVKPTVIPTVKPTAKPTVKPTVVPPVVPTPDRWCWHPCYGVWYYNCLTWIDPNSCRPGYDDLFRRHYWAR